jgi:hypothetical protein
MKNFIQPFKSRIAQSFKGLLGVSLILFASDIVSAQCSTTGMTDNSFFTQGNSLGAPIYSTPVRVNRLLGFDVGDYITLQNVKAGSTYTITSTGAAVMAYTCHSGTVQTNGLSFTPTASGLARIFITNSGSASFNEEVRVACSSCSSAPTDAPANDLCAGAAPVAGIYNAPLSALPTVPSFVANTTGNALTTANTIRYCDAATESSAFDDDTWYAFTTPSNGQLTVQYRHITTTNTRAGASPVSHFGWAIVPAACSTPTLGTAVACFTNPADAVNQTVNLAANTAYKIRVWTTLSGSTGAADFYLSAPGGTFPVELVSFKGEKKGNVNLLTWKTASEKNTNVFLIERSSNGISDWKALASVKAAGFTTQEENYSFEDKNPLNLGYYRLHILDFDGKAEFSNVFTIRRAGAKNSALKISPSLAADFITAQFDAQNTATALVQIVDMSGLVYKTMQLNTEFGKNAPIISTENLPAGFYVLRLNLENETLTERFVKQ